jgi:hypothetical protein
LSTASQSHYPLQLHLIHEKLSNFATETRVPFQLAFFNLDAMDPTELLAMAAGDTVALFTSRSAQASTGKGKLVKEK